MFSRGHSSTIADYKLAGYNGVMKFLKTKLLKQIAWWVIAIAVIGGIVIVPVLQLISS